MKKMNNASVSPNVEVTGAARLYRAASGGPQGYATTLRDAMTFRLPHHRFRQASNYLLPILVGKNYFRVRRRSVDLSLMREVIAPSDQIGVCGANVSAVKCKMRSRSSVNLLFELNNVLVAKTRQVFILDYLRLNSAVNAVEITFSEVPKYLVLLLRELNKYVLNRKLIDGNGSNGHEPDVFDP
jgi:hypothetical protein